MRDTELRLHHRQQRRYLHPTGPESLVVRLRLRPPLPAAAFLHYRAGGRWDFLPLYPYAATKRSLYLQARLEGVPPPLEYYFRAYLASGPSFYLGRDGTRATEAVIPFTYSWRPEEVFRTPDWVQDAIFYQIFPDRFANGDPTNDPPTVQPWGGEPTRHSFFGGDLEGIRQAIWYLKELGVNALWLNPIFAAPSNHRYDTRDYLAIEPMLGDKATFRRLLRELHQAGIRLVLDGVFNHTGNHFWAFEDIRRRGEASPYLSWYYVHDLPLRTEPKPNYACWWDFAELPKLRETNPLVRRYLLGVGQYWTSYGIDGWRLDVPNEIKGDFWVEFRRLVKAINPDAYLVGEIWGDGRPWLRGDQFDAVMNYPWRELALDWFLREKTDLLTFDRLLARLRLRYHEQVNYCQLNLLGSHDTARLFTEASRALGQPGAAKGEAARRLVPLIVFQMTYVGVPMIFYGDEIGLEGEQDPDCRRCFPWEPGRRKQQLFLLYRQLISLRHRYSALRRGTFEVFLVEASRRLYGYRRRWRQEEVYVVLNAGPEPQTVRLPLAAPGDAYDLLREEPLATIDGAATITLAPYDASVVATVPAAPPPTSGPR